MCILYSMNRDELTELKRQIESEYKTDMAAVNQLLKRYPEKIDRTPLLLRTDGETEKPLFGLVAGFVESMSGKFSLSDIAELVTAATGSPANRQTISGALFRLKEDGKIKTIQTAQGRRPAVYEKV